MSQLGALGINGTLTKFLHCGYSRTAIPLKFYSFFYYFCFILKLLAVTLWIASSSLTLCMFSPACTQGLTCSFTWDFEQFFPRGLLVVVMAMCVCVCSVYCGRWGAVKGGVGKQDLDRKWKGSPKYLGMVGGGEVCY